MSLSGFTPLLGAADPSTIERAMTSGAARPPAQVAAEQFEAVLVRQLLGDALKPMLGGALGGEDTPGSGVYQYLVTDVVAQSVAAGGGLGLAKMLVPHLGAKDAPPAGADHS